MYLTPELGKGVTSQGLIDLDLVLGQRKVYVTREKLQLHL